MEKRRERERESALRKFIRSDLPKKTRKESEPQSESNLFQGGRKKIIIPSNVIDNWTTLKVLRGYLMGGHTDTLTEASNLIDQFYKKSEIQNELSNVIAPDKFHTLKMELPSKILEQIVFNTRAKIEKHVSTFMDKSIHVKKHLMLHKLILNNSNCCHLFNWF